MNDYGKPRNCGWTVAQVRNYRAKRRNEWIASLRRAHQKRGRR